MKDHKKIILACPHGFCSGVGRAIAAAEETIRLYGAPVYCYNEIVHNRIVVESLASRGMIFTSSMEDIPENAVTLFSAHGVSPEIRNIAEKRHLKVIDATCPFVAKIHSEVRKYAAKDFSIILIGHKGHEEVEGVRGEAPDNVTVVEDEEQARTVAVKNPDQVAVVTQTTLSVTGTDRITGILNTRFPGLAAPGKSDICYATQNRQRAVRAVASRADFMIVLGSHNSSNSRRLVEVAGDCGCKAALAGSIDELRNITLNDVNVLGLTAAASTPEPFVEEVIKELAKMGYCNIEECITAEEDITFPLPKELNTGTQQTK